MLGYARRVVRERSLIERDQQHHERLPPKLIAA
jgi:hypothetical protein